MKHNECQTFFLFLLNFFLISEKLFFLFQLNFFQFRIYFILEMLKCLVSFLCSIDTTYISENPIVGSPIMLSFLCTFLIRKRLVSYIKRLLPWNVCIFYWEKIVAYHPLYFVQALQRNEEKVELDLQGALYLILYRKTFSNIMVLILVCFFLFCFFCFKCFTQ